MEEQEFSFLELFKYALKKWFIIVAALVLGVAAAFVYAYVGRSETPTVNAYEGSIRYVGDFPSADGSDFGTRYELYKIKASAALAVMTSTQVKNEVYEKFRNQLYPDLKKDEDRSEEFFKALNVTVSDNTMFLSFGRIVGSDLSNGATLTSDIVANYLETAAEAARKADPTLIGAGKLIINEPVQLYNIKGYYELFGISDSGRSVSTWLVLGTFGGLILGAVIVLIIYAADPKIKSFRSVAYLVGGRNFGVCESAADLKKISVDIDNTLKPDEKTVCFVAPGRDALVRDASKVCAEMFAYEGYRTLLVSFAGEESGVERFLSGASAADTVKKGDYDLICGTENGWLKLGPNAKRFETLKSEYDRVVIEISAPENGGAGSAVKFSDAAVMVVDGMTVKKRDILRLAESLPAGDRDKLIGAVLHDLSKSYVG